MKYIIHIIKKILPKELPKPLGRWKIENCNMQINNKIDLSNEDHCGPCGQYALSKINLKNDNRDNYLKPLQQKQIIKQIIKK
jgi:hypothetical protein